MRLALDEVEAPDMIAPLRPQPDAGAVVEPEPAPSRLLLQYFQPLAAPDALDPILADIDAALIQDSRHPAIAVAAVCRGEINDVAGQLILVGLERRNVSLRSSRLSDNPAGLSLAQPILLSGRLGRLPAPLGAYNFPCAISLSTCFSRDKSATSFFSRPFSSSSCFRRFA